MKKVKRIAITGAAGNIAYSLIFRVAHGDIYGKDQPIALHLLDIAQMATVLEGVKMELEDCAFPLLKEVRIGSDPKKMFEDVDLALLVGAKPRGPGMERVDLLRDNGKIFVEQGSALNEVASQDVKVLVVGNPCNTNCLIAMHYAPRIPRKNFFAMTRLDQNRAQSMLALKAGVDVSDVKRMTIWGNHSTSQVPDFFNATIQGRPALQAIGDRAWLENEFVPLVQKRGAQVIAARGKSSAASAANAAVDAIRSILMKTPLDDWFSMGIVSDGNPYGIEEDLIYSFPCTSVGQGDARLVGNLSLDNSLKEKIKATEKELIEEKRMVEAFLAV